MIEGKKGFAVV